MSWNRPKTVEQPDAAKSKRPARNRRAVVFGLLAIGALVSCWLVFRPHEKPVSTSDDHRKGRIKEVQPAAAPKAEPAKPEKELSYNEKKLKYYREKYGDNLPENLKPVVYYLEHPPKQIFGQKGAADFLRHSSERQIAGVALKEPGTLFIIQPTFDERFNRDFINAMVDKIEINEDDSEEVRAIKEDVTAAKKEIAAICKKEGKKPSEVMNELAASMYELGRYRQTLEAEISKVRDNPDCSDADFEDFVKAANLMLKNKGMPEMAMPNLARRSFRLKFLAARAEKQALKAKAQEGEKK